MLVQGSSELLEDWLRLIRDNNWSLRKKHELLAYYGSPAAIYAEPKRRLSLIVKQSYQTKKAVSPDRLVQDMAWLATEGHILITIDCPVYPVLLKEIVDPPLALFAIGDTSLLNAHQVAIVGSRRPTPIGQQVSHSFANKLAQQGVVITSGMALGVDACAHRGALAVEGGTVAVMGCGLDSVYPARHRDLFDRIGQLGLLVSEYPPGSLPSRHHFPQRNRIVSGLAYGVIIVEAAINSGTLITARLAIEQNRDVFVVPGGILNKQYAGSHQLIRQGAILVQTVEHVLQELPISFEQELRNTSKLIDSKQVVCDKLLDFVEYEPTLIEDIILARGLTAAQVSSMLLLIEIEGQVAVSDEGRYIKLV